MVRTQALLTMVLIKDSISEHVWCKVGLCFENKIWFDDSFDETKCLQKIEIHD